MNRLTKVLGIAAALCLAVSAVFATGASASHPTHKAHKGHKHHKKHKKPKKNKTVMQPTKISCGMVVMKSIQVMNDLTCPVPSNPGPPGKGTPPFGILVVGSNITVDLNGHTITGPRVSGTSQDLTLGHSVEMIGVQMNKVSHDVVENGTIRHFDAGLDDAYGDHNLITNLTLTDNQNYEVINGAIDYLPPSPTLTTVTPTGSGSGTTTYNYEIVTTQVANPATTLGDNGQAPAGGTPHSYTQDSLVSGSKSVTNDATLSATSYNTITFTGAGPSYATGYRILRSVGTGPYVWVGTVLASASKTNTYTFTDNGQAPASTGQYYEVSLTNNNVGVDDSCNNGDGIDVDAATNDTVTNNTLINNGPFSGIAMVAEFNPTAKAYDAPTHNLIENNTITHNAVENLDPGFNNPKNRGLSAYCGTGASGGTGGGGMTRGRLVQDSGIRIEGPEADYNTVKDNHVEGSGFNGIAIHSFVCNDTSGPQPNSGPNSYNTITGNTIWDTGKYTPAGDETSFDGIGWLASGPANVVCVSPNNTVTNNTSFDNLHDGIYLGGRANQGNTVSGNTVYNNANDGIEVAAGAAGYGANTFNANHGYSNGHFDGEDANVNCGPNLWSADVFTKASQACVK